MRPILAKEMRKQFDRQLTERFPEFHLVKGEEIPPGNRLYIWEIAQDFRLYLHLGFHPLREGITLELAWTKKSRWPAYEYSKSPYEPTAEGDVRFRLYKLWNEERPLDLWWIGPTLGCYELELRDIPVPLPDEELLPEVPKVVADAIDKFEEYGIPYLEKVTSEHGYDIKSRKPDGDVSTEQDKRHRRKS